MKYILNFSSENKFISANIMHDDFICEQNVLEVTEKEYFDFLKLISEQVSDNIHILLNEVFLQNNEIKVRKLYNKKQIIALENEYKINNLVDQAKHLLTENEWRWLNPIKYGRYNKKQQELLTTFYDNIIKVINKESILLPDYDIVEELSKLS